MSWEEDWWENRQSLMNVSAWLLFAGMEKSQIEAMSSRSLAFVKHGSVARRSGRGLEAATLFGGDKCG